MAPLNYEHKLNGLLPPKCCAMQGKKTEFFIVYQIHICEFERSPSMQKFLKWPIYVSKTLIWRKRAHEINLVARNIERKRVHQIPTITSVDGNIAHGLVRREKKVNWLREYSLDNCGSCYTFVCVNIFHYVLSCRLEEFGVFEPPKFIQFAIKLYLILLMLFSSFWHISELKHAWMVLP